MRLFHFEKGQERVPMHTLFGDLQEVYYASKAEHHRTILKKVQRMDPSVTDFSQFLFFDNQQNNISAVSRVGVCSVYCGGGMTPGTFERGLKMWRQMHKL
ncbi:hypothetical protein STCU_03795 [Strigomonas culicis]|nr:hypothetical protein STCU_03795 [Strigomonas culicis]|eukprot:EPY30908.1 hypothetical protein STCU_03795 [Strigomonas culicis]